MTVIEESGLEFTFGPQWKVMKYDGDDSFYRLQMAPATQFTKAMDFLCLSDRGGALLVEVKNYSRGMRPSDEKILDLPQTVAQKARDTLAGMVGGARCSDTPSDRVFFQDAMRRLNLQREVLRIAFFYEPFTPSRTAYDMKRRRIGQDVLRKDLQRRLRWLSGSVEVFDLSTYSSFLSDVTVRRTEPPAS